MVEPFSGNSIFFCCICMYILTSSSPFQAPKQHGVSHRVACGGGNQKGMAGCDNSSPYVRRMCYNNFATTPRQVQKGGVLL